MISSYVFTSICFRGGEFGVLSVIRREHTWRPKWPHHVGWLRAAAAQHFQMTLWTLNWHSNLPVACQSWESHLYASKPLAWRLTRQSSVNYSVTDNRTVILQTITRAIRVLWIASSGPESCQCLHSTGAREWHSPPMTSDDFFLSLFYRLMCVSGWLPPWWRWWRRLAESSQRAWFWLSSPGKGTQALLASPQQNPGSVWLTDFTLCDAAMENYLGAFFENAQKSQLWLRAPHRQCTLIVMAVSEKYGHGDSFWEQQRGHSFYCFC